ncbi:MFS family permease [Actinoplanes lutulentus]|uniref:Putative MFS family arabinose efflux permease n=1 Tax=Actinoplanes lutulentus TaxID=1287878 RepID=A0A327Z2C9_9ACTN|nr:MFS transporter [Actinoplanes lutulentus]MBB2946299.1 MFS family permease [Actinoplanes lutulentus]RAK28762.1 putative MFS family arabinose efflux permease [Actinoplanes lutulentus]
MRTDTPGAAGPRSRTFASFRYGSYRLWFAGQSISQTGFWFYVVTQSLLVLELTDSGTMVGIVTAVQNIPLFLVAPYAGALTDRVDTRRLILATQAVTTVSSLLLGLLVLAHLASVVWVLVFATVTGVAWAFDQPARRTFAAELVPEEAVTNALSLNGVLLQLARMVGPALAAVVISSFGFGWGFVATGVCTSLSLLALVIIGRAGEVFRSPAGPVRGTLREGLRLAWSDRYLRVVLLLLFGTSTLAFNWNVLFPLFAVRDLRGTSVTFALLMAAMAVGSIVGAFWLARRTNVGGQLLAGGSCVYGAAQLCLAASPSVGLAAATAVLLGLGTTVLVNGGAAGLQLRVDKGMRGRMMGLFTVAVLGGVGLGAPLSGFVAETFGTRLALVLGGVCALIGGLVVLWLLRPAGGRR